MAPMSADGARPRRAARVVLWGVLVLLCAACTTGNSTDSHAVNTTHGPATSHETATVTATARPAVSDGTIRLKCRSGQAPGLGKDMMKTVLGVTADGFDGGFASGRPVDSSPLSYNGLSLVKSVLYVSSAASRGTLIEVLSPKAAGLYYTSWKAWGNSPTAKDVTQGARRVVAVGGCDQKALMFPGGIVVAQPTCVTLRISSDHHHQDVRVPIGKRCTARS